MQERLCIYDEKVLRRLIQLEAQRRQEQAQRPLAYVKWNTDAGAAMRRLEQMGMIGATYKDNNPYVVEVLAKGYSYISSIDAERQRMSQMEDSRRADRRHDWLITVFTVLMSMGGVIAGFMIGRLF
ncbi:MAG: histidine kinase [Eggerthellales bacterium]|nr:histidine kinase [Eggerthellales bacterium]